MKQKIDKSEPYFVHVGYSYVCELRKYKKARFRYKQIKTRSVVQERINKLERYWKRAL